jgi:hypothetical protein
VRRHFCKEQGTAQVLLEKPPIEEQLDIHR